MNQETQEMETLKSPPQPAGFLNICPAAVFWLFRSSPCIRIRKGGISPFAAARIYRLKISSCGSAQVVKLFKIKETVYIRLVYGFT
jgi:hypothetical protein